ncbi:MAG: DUF2255 family protein [Myxococcota bacterium]
MRILLTAIGLFVGVVVLGALAIDEGEVVTLTTQDAHGRSQETQLWIVDLEGTSYLRSATPETEWLDRLRADPRGQLRRGEEEQPIQAVPMDGGKLRVQVNRAMAAKYGVADRLYSRLYDRSRSVPVRILPVSSDETAASNVH